MKPYIDVQDVCPLPVHLGVYLDEVAAASAHTGHSNQVFPSLKDVWPELRQLGTQILKNLQSSPGYVVLQNFPFLTLGPKYHHVLLLGLVEMLGAPSSTGGARGKVVWEVTPRSNLPAGYTPSITERSGEADLHTDSQYRSRPEDCVLLSVVRPASSGGETLLLHGDKLIEMLRSNEDGRAAHDILRQVKLPFAVPMAFRVNPDIAEYIAAAIFSETPSVRYRQDTLAEGFAIAPSLETKEASWALDILGRVIQSAVPQTTREALGAGDIILINNHCVLHGRTDFRDARRLLLRIRVETHQLHS